jgi:hypothetical protein
LCQWAAPPGEPDGVREQKAMTRITGNYTLVETGVQRTLSIDHVDGSGNVVGDLNGVKIFGQYYTSNETIFFTTQHPDPTKVLVDYYTGKVEIDTDVDTVIGMFGSRSFFYFRNQGQHTWFATRHPSIE